LARSSFGHNFPWKNGEGQGLRENDQEMSVVIADKCAAFLFGSIFLVVRSEKLVLDNQALVVSIAAVLH
jgi:hypothetical protein